MAKVTAALERGFKVKSEHLGLINENDDHLLVFSLGPPEGKSCREWGCKAPPRTRALLYNYTTAQEYELEYCNEHTTQAKMMGIAYA